MEKYLGVIVLICLFVFIYRYFKNLSEQSKKQSKMLDDMTISIKRANTIEDVNKEWDNLHEKCIKNSFFIIDTQFREKFIELDAICKTKFEMLNNL